MCTVIDVKCTHQYWLTGAVNKPTTSHVNYLERPAAGMIHPQEWNIWFTRYTFSFPLKVGASFQQVLLPAVAFQFSIVPQPSRSCGYGKG